MIYGIGIDIIETDRIEKSLRSEAFLKRVFSKNEIALFEKRHFSSEVVAGNFAAKEAAMKAFGKGFSSGLYSYIEVLRKKDGKPFINLLGEAKKTFDELGCKNIFISISNIKEIVCAQVIIEK